MADIIATKPEKGNLCHGFSLRQFDQSISKESGKTCMKPVARMIPAAKALRMTNMFLSGCNIGIDRVTSGEPTPMTLAMRIEKMAMILRRKALSLFVHELAVVSHSSDCETAWIEKKQMRNKKIEKGLVKDAIGFDFWLLSRFFLYLNLDL